MADLRHYSRETLNIDCVFYSSNNFELVSKLINVSESGILLEVDRNEDLLQRLKIGDTVKFQSIQSIGDSKPYIFQEVSEIVRIEELDNKIRIACKVSMRDKFYQKFIFDLKVFRYRNRYKIHIIQHYCNNRCILK